MIYVTGDVHADIQRFSDNFAKKLKSEDIVLVCGDFGFIWDGSLEEEKALDKLERKPFNIAFVDGTHENFELLNKYPAVDFCSGQARKIRNNIYYLERGEIFEIEGKKFFAMGGGESEDKEERCEAGNWWAEEMPSNECISKAKKNLETCGNRVDYVITHEPPTDIGRLIDSSINKVHPLSLFFEYLSKNVRYKKWFFGSMHIDRKVSGIYYSVFDSIVTTEPVAKKGFFAKLFKK